MPQPSSALSLFWLSSVYGYVMFLKFETEFETISDQLSGKILELLAKLEIDIGQHLQLLRSLIYDLHSQKCSDLAGNL